MGNAVMAHFMMLCLRSQNFIMVKLHFSWKLREDSSAFQKFVDGVTSDAIFLLPNLAGIYNISFIAYAALSWSLLWKNHEGRYCVFDPFILCQSHPIMTV